MLTLSTSLTECTEQHVGAVHNCLSHFHHTENSRPCAREAPELWPAAGVFIQWQRRMLQHMQAGGVLWSRRAQKLQQSRVAGQSSGGSDNVLQAALQHLPPCGHHLRHHPAQHRPDSCTSLASDAEPCTNICRGSLQTTEQSHQHHVLTGQNDCVVGMGDACKWGL